MGGSQSSETRKKIINDSTIKNIIKRTTEVINKTVAKTIQENLTNISSGAVVEQTIDFSNMKISGGTLTIGDITQDANVKINLSALANTDMKTELIQDTIGQIQNKMEQVSNSTQKQLEEQGEQVFGELLKSLASTVQSLGASVTGTSTSSVDETTFRNILDIENNTELTNRIEQAVNIENVSKTVNDIANAFASAQNINYSEMEITDGSVIIGNINQNILTEQITSSISNSGISEEIISAMSGLSKDELSTATEVEVEQTKEDKGTIEAAGEAATSIISTGGFYIMVPLVIGAVIIIFILKPLLPGLLGISSGNPQGPPPEYYNDYEMTGAGPGVSIINTLTKYLQTGAKLFKKHFLKILITISLLILIRIVYKVFIKKSKENFTETSKLSDLIMMINNKYVGETNDKSLGLKEVELSAVKVAITLFLDKKEIFILRKDGVSNNKLYLKYNEKSKTFSFEKYKMSQDRLFKFQYINDNSSTLEENVYKLKINGKFLTVDKDILTLGDKTSAVNVKFT